MRADTNIQMSTVANGNSINGNGRAEITKLTDSWDFSATLSKALRPLAATSLVRVLAIGSILAASTLFAGAASADSPDSPAVEPDARSTISGSAMSFPDVDDYDTLEYQARLVTRTTRMEFPSVDDYDGLEYRGRLGARTTKMEFPSVDDYDGLEYRARLVARTTRVEFPSVDDYDDLEYRGSRLKGFGSD